ncbi:vitrin [Chlorella sorokiniana]|uniref:Vitrin n=1 Tax=Chlorella sorokiniana TaxID=3076 RepID=A0A2P6TN11_CHLSO|nr:vitrin [Chlorella sorokiniana]|eukprot:PRW45710.1 vitrin [Chlorella sorokiniana]
MPDAEKTFKNANETQRPLQIYKDGFFQTVYGHTGGVPLAWFAVVACRNLGFDAGELYAWNSDGRATITDIECSGNSTAIGECPLTVAPEQSSKELFVVGARCYNTTDPPEDGSFRLSNCHEGLPEIALDGVCGSICTADDLNQRLNNYQVMCKLAKVPWRWDLAHLSGPYASGPKWASPVFVRKLACKGSESSILDCDFEMADPNDWHALQWITTRMKSAQEQLAQIGRAFAVVNTTACSPELATAVKQIPPRCRYALASLNVTSGMMDFQYLFGSCGVGFSETALDAGMAPGCAAAAGSIWGTGVYTGRSAVCRAAIRAGVIKDAGGNFAVMYVPGQTAYKGGVANGVGSIPLGAWNASFVPAQMPAV